MGKLYECAKCVEKGGEVTTKTTLSGLGKSAKAAAKAGKWVCNSCRHG